MFCGISTDVFLVIKSGGEFQMSVSGCARFFPAARLYVSLRILLQLVEIYKLYGLDLILV